VARALSVGVVLALFGLSACVEGPEPVEAAAPAPAPAAVPPAAPAAGNPVVPDAPPPEPRKPVLTISSLMGADRDTIVRLLGPPSFLRRDPPAELWRYRAADCLLDLYLYPPDGTRGTMGAVKYVEARGRDGRDRPAPPCLDAVLKAREGAGTG
jgi:hypothetical protein